MSLQGVKEVMVMFGKSNVVLLTVLAIVLALVVVDEAVPVQKRQRSPSPTRPPTRAPPPWLDIFRPMANGHRTQRP